MELTLLLPGQEARGLNRLPAVRTARAGKTRGQAVRIVWYDGPGHELAERGLVLARESGTKEQETREPGAREPEGKETAAGESGPWRLEQHRPDAAEAWPPGTDHRLIEASAGPEPPPRPVPDTLAAMACFEGRRTVFSLAQDGAAVTMTLLDGVLRMGAAEHPATRLILNGPRGAVRSLALALAAALTVSIPVESLAMEARRLGDGTPPVPRRSGPPVLPPRAASPGTPLSATPPHGTPPSGIFPFGTSPSGIFPSGTSPSGALSTHAAFTHVLGHLTDVVLFLAAQVREGRGEVEVVHQMRVAVRRARSALSLFRPVILPSALSPAAEGLKDLGRMLGPARDWDVFMTETLPPVAAALPDQPALTGLLQAGARRREEARAALAAYLDSRAFRAICVELACLAALEPEGEEGPPLTAFAVSVLRARWKKLRGTGKSLDALDHSGLHALRLKAKRARYAAEFLVSLFPARPAARFIRRLSAVQEHLGVFNDTAAAAALLRELSGEPDVASGLVLGFTAARGAGILPRIGRSWRRLRRCAPFWE